ncbi:MAG TPA: type III pantothenate kinase [Bryobacteraceae bacterium]|nr:type III pantothenate kinase [Bryobacteraceae bacterium]
MLLALDAGNTNITIGVFADSQIAARWRLRTIHDQTADEWGILILNLLAMSHIDKAGITGIAISSVVPPIRTPLAEMAERYFRLQPLFIGEDTDTGLHICYENPREVGADRIVNSLAAFQKYGGPCVVVDLGTAITFDAISARAEYLGGLIFPGIGISTGALFARTARLPMVELRDPGRLIGTNTVGSIQSGLYWGYISLIDGVLEKMIAELGPETKTVATGGQAGLIFAASKYLQHIDDDLTLEGLRIAWERSQRP